MRLDQSKYIEYLEKEIVRLTIENNKKMDIQPSILHEHSYPSFHPPLTYQLPRKASMFFQKDVTPCTDAIILSWGDHNQTLYMDQTFKYSMDAMHHLIDKFFYGLCRSKVAELEALEKVKNESHT